MEYFHTPNIRTSILHRFPTSPPGKTILEACTWRKYPVIKDTFSTYSIRRQPDVLKVHPTAANIQNCGLLAHGNDPAPKDIMFQISNIRLIPAVGPDSIAKKVVGCHVKVFSDGALSPQRGCVGNTSVGRPA